MCLLAVAAYALLVLQLRVTLVPPGLEPISAAREAGLGASRIAAAPSCPSPPLAGRAAGTPGRPSFSPPAPFGGQGGSGRGRAPEE